MLARARALFIQGSRQFAPSRRLKQTPTQVPTFNVPEYCLPGDKSGPLLPRD